MSNTAQNLFQFDTSTLVFALPEIFLLSSIVVILLIDVFLKKSFKNITYYLSQIAIFITALLSYSLIGNGEQIIFSGSFIHDDLAAIFKVAMMVASIVVLVYSRTYLNVHNLFKGEYFVLVLLAILGMMVMVSGYSLLPYILV